MPSYILVKATDGWNPTDEMCWQTGYLVNVRSFSRLGGKQVPPEFIQIEITDDDDWQAIQDTYCGEWLKIIDWEFVAHNYVIDGHRLRVFMVPEVVSVGGLNSLTRDQVEGFLNNWGASVFDIAPNEVVFDATIFNAIKSSSFWDKDTSLLTFVENNYDFVTGIHNVQCNYKDDPDISALSKQQIEQYIIDRGGSIISHPTNKVTFEISRDNVFDAFKLDVKAKIKSIYSLRKFKVLQTHIDMALANNGTLSVTKQQFAQYIYNRLND